MKTMSSKALKDQSKTILIYPYGTESPTFIIYSLKPKLDL